MIVYLVCYAASLLLALGRHYLLSGAGLLAAAVYLYASDYIRSGNLLHLRGIFALSFVGGQGLACMKLSYLSLGADPDMAYSAVFIDGPQRYTKNG